MGYDSFFSEHNLLTINICTKFHENIPDDIKVMEGTRFSFEKFHRGIIP